MSSTSTIGNSAAARSDTTVEPLDVVGCGVFSSAGQGLGPLAAALSVGAPAVDPSHDETFPPRAVRPLPDFDPVALLGRKGLTRMTRTDQLGMAACAAALEQAGAGPAADRTGIVLGTALGSSAALADFLTDTFQQDLPYLVNPSHFPGTLLNSAAGKAAIRFGLTGVNATVSGGPVAALHALRFARNALSGGHARRLLTGAVEELSVPAAWTWHRSGALRPETTLTEGGAVFAVQAAEPRPSESLPPLGRLLACEIGYADPANGPLAVSRRLASCIRQALDRSGVATEAVALTVPGAGGRRGWAAVEERALREVFPAPASDGGPRRLRIDRVLGDAHGAGAALQLAAVLARWQYPPADEQGVAAERFAVVTSVAPDGSVGCLVVTRNQAC